MLSPNGPSKLGKVEAGSLLSLRIHLPKGAPGCQTQDSATGTSPTWPLASDWVTTPRSPRTSVPATSIKRTLLSNPKGPRKGARSGQHATHCWQTAGGNCPGIAPWTMHPSGMWMEVANPLPALSRSECGTWSHAVMSSLGARARGGVVRLRCFSVARCQTRPRSQIKSSGSRQPALRQKFRTSRIEAP